MHYYAQRSQLNARMQTAHGTPERGTREDAIHWRCGPTDWSKLPVTLEPAAKLWLAAEIWPSLMLHCLTPPTTSTTTLGQAGQPTASSLRKVRADPCPIAATGSAPKAYSSSWPGPVTPGDAARAAATAAACTSGSYFLSKAIVFSKCVESYGHTVREVHDIARFRAA